MKTFEEWGLCFDEKITTESMNTIFLKIQNDSWICLMMYSLTLKRNYWIIMIAYVMLLQTALERRF